MGSLAPCRGVRVTRRARKPTTGLCKQKLHSGPGGATSVSATCAGHWWAPSHGHCPFSSRLAPVLSGCPPLLTRLRDRSRLV